jgi:hypothetical protein
VSDIIEVKCPYGKPGDYLWVREAWCLTQPHDPETYHFGYKSGIQPYSSWPASDKWNYQSPDKWHPSIHMPKEAARIILQVEDVHLERLHDITEGAAMAEGFDLDTGNTVQSGRVMMISASYIRSFKNLWVKIRDQQSWDINPWLWVISYKVISTAGCPEELKPLLYQTTKKSKK